MLDDFVAEKVQPISSKRDYMKKHYLDAAEMLELEKMIRNRWLYRLINKSERNILEFPEAFSILEIVDEKDLLDLVLLKTKNHFKENELEDFTDEEKLFATGELDCKLLDENEE